MLAPNRQQDIFDAEERYTYILSPLDNKTNLDEENITYEKQQQSADGWRRFPLIREKKSNPQAS